MATFPGTIGNDVLPMLGEDNSGDDVLWGGMGDDDLSGGAGNDTLIGGAGADVLDGGPGHDIASYTQSRHGVHIDLSAAFYDPHAENAPVRGGEATGDQLSGIEELWGSARADKLIGNHAANRLFGNGGNDHVYGGGGDDFLRGGDEDDVLKGDAGADKLFGDMGFDELTGGAGNDLLFGGKGDDSLLDGGAGDDVLEGGMGADKLMGGAGMDVAAYTMSDMPVTINLSNIGTAKKAAEGGHADGDMIMMDVEGVRGSMYDDMITGSSAMTDDATTEDVDESMMYPGHNKLYGNMGDDTLMGLGGNDLIHGGQGMDTLYGGAGNDTLKGDMGDDALKGEDGDDTLVGGPGADKLFGGEFNKQTMKAGDDDSMNDTADYSMSDAGVTIDLSKTSRAMPNPVGEGGHAEGDEIVGIEHLTGSMYDDMLEGTSDANILKGMDGDDMLTGNAGADTLDGGKGDDTLNGGAGADELTGGDGDDTFVYTNSAAGTQVYDAPGTGDGDTDNGDETTYRAIDIDADMANDGDTMVSGGDGMDIIDASSSTAAVNINLNIMLRTQEFAADDPNTEDVDESRALEEAAIYKSIEQVMGGEGNDTLMGNAAAPTTLMGGEGNDTLTGGSMDDMLEGGSDDDSLRGMGGNDMLDGGSGNDTLVGGTGADTLMAGTGDDTLSGDSGQDVFVYTGGTDTITDFTVSRAGGDRINLTHLELTAEELELIVEAANKQDGTTVYLELTINDNGTVTEGTAEEHDIALTNFPANTDLATSDFIID